MEVSNKETTVATRTDEILSAVDSLFKVHDAWEADDSSPVQPSEAFESAIIEAVAVADKGDTPAQCRELCVSLARLGLEWNDYAKGTKRTRDHRPIGSFWGAYRNVVTCRAGASTYEPKQPEPVFMLLEQKGPYHQIALHIWGHKGQGPFVTAAGQPDIAKIHEEGKEPGKYTKHWTHPEQLALAAGRKSELSRRLNAATAREGADTPTVEKASVEEMLREGQYPDVIANVKGVTLDDVLSSAKRLGVVPNERPNLASLRAPQEPGIFGASDTASQPTGVKESLESDAGDDGEDEDQDSEADDGPSIAEQIVSLNDGVRGKPEILAEMKSRGHDVTFKQIGYALRGTSKRQPVAVG